MSKQIEKLRAKGPIGDILENRVCANWKTVAKHDKSEEERMTVNCGKANDLMGLGPGTEHFYEFSLEAVYRVHFSHVKA